MSMNEDDEMSDQFEEEDNELTQSPRSPDKIFFPTSDNPNKPQSLYDQYREKRITEESVDQQEREYLESRLRSLVSINPKIKIGKPSDIQLQLSDMDLAQLKFAVQSAEDQSGLSDPFGPAKIGIQLFDYGLQQACGKQFQPEVYQDPQFLNAINRMLPSIAQSYNEALTFFAKLVGYFLHAEPLPVPALPVVVAPPPPGAGVGGLQ